MRCLCGASADWGVQNQPPRDHHASSSKAGCTHSKRIKWICGRSAHVSTRMPPPSKRQAPTNW
eukprot:145313-Prorocentrum_lima.AAC.1